MIRAVIIDDSKHAVDLLSSLIDKTSQDITLLGTAHAVPEGVELIRKLKPNLVFLDIDLGNQTGFDLLAELSAVSFDLIFTTAYNEYAMEAFKYNAVYYLLKPIREEALAEALGRIRKKEQDRSVSYEGIRKIIEEYGTGHARKLSLCTEEGIRFINTEDILYIQADGSYSRVKMFGGSSYLLSKLLKDFESQINSRNFYRISKSYLINMQHVIMYRRIDGGTVEMGDGKQIPVPRRKREEFMSRMTEFME
jgi:two-component system LytT family response regulator